ncbi:MAG TPA: O-antigen ligase family protein [Pyrinomonadaceae bacterium]|nr:O-antigen ligase family protein [Pyrinomonadaceae bacterium]
MTSPTPKEILREARRARREAGRAPVQLDRAVVGCLFAFALCAPHSIAATQAAWLLGMLLWLARFLVRPRPALRRTPLDFAIGVFFLLTLVSTFFSYEPAVSWGKMRAASLFTIVYLVAENVRGQKILRALVLVLVASCSVNVVHTVVERARGRGVKVTALATDSPLREAHVREGDTVISVDGRKVSDPAEIERALAGGIAPNENAAGAQGATAPGAKARVRFYRLEMFHEPEMERAGARRAGATPEERLGIGGWARGRDERAVGFYGHYTTYAEVLQLVGSLAFGLLVALGRLRSFASVALALASAGMGYALLLTVTRASWLAFLISCFVIVLAGAASRRALLAAAVVAALVVPAGLYVLRQKRQVGFFDRGDGSVSWRETTYRDGWRVLTSNPRHLLVGTGMDSLKRRWPEWGMFEGGRLPWGHLHSTPLQIAFERGVPALLAWLVWLALYARLLWRESRAREPSEWVERGLALGALGGAVGFFTSGLVHYNLGDSEVVMVFYFIMGLALALWAMRDEKAKEAGREKEKTAGDARGREPAVA